MIRISRLSDRSRCESVSKWQCPSIQFGQQEELLSTETRWPSFAVEVEPRSHELLISEPIRDRGRAGRK